MIKRLLTYALPAVMLLPVAPIQAAQDTNIFSAEVMGRTVRINLNPNLTESPNYIVEIGRQVGITSLQSFMLNDGALQARFEVDDVAASPARRWRGSTTSCAAAAVAASPLCGLGTQSQTPFIITLNGGPQTTDIRPALGTSSSIQAEKISITTKPALVVAVRSPQGVTSFKSLAQTDNIAIAAAPQAVESFDGTAVWAMAPLLSRVYLWTTSSTEGNYIRSCPINHGTGLAANVNTCVNMPVTETYRDVEVMPNAGATVWVAADGSLQYRTIEANASLSSSRKRLEVTGDGVENESLEYVYIGPSTSSSRYAATDLGTLGIRTADYEVESSMVLTAPSAGLVYQCSIPKLSTSGEVSAACNKLTLLYPGSLAGMVKPQFLVPNLFMTAVDKALIMCKRQAGKDFVYACEDVATLDAAVEVISSTINLVKTRYFLNNEGQSLQAGYQLIFGIGLAEKSATYQSSLLLANLRLTESFSFIDSTATGVAGFGGSGLAESSGVAAERAFAFSDSVYGIRAF